MKLLKKVAIAAALSSVAAYASALTPIADNDLSKVSGRDGVSIAADLNINVGSFVYTDTDSNGGSVSFNNIAITGVIGATLDIISNTQFQSDAMASLDGGVTANANTVLAVTGGADAQSFMAPGDVVKIAIPKVTSAKNLNMSVQSITMGGSTASYGSMAMNDVKLQGTTVYIWAH